MCIQIHLKTKLFGIFSYIRSFVYFGLNSIEYFQFKVHLMYVCMLANKNRQYVGVCLWVCIIFFNTAFVCLFIVDLLVLLCGQHVASLLTSLRDSSNSVFYPVHIHLSLAQFLFRLLLNDDADADDDDVVELLVMVVFSILKPNQSHNSQSTLWIFLQRRINDFVVLLRQNSFAYLFCVLCCCCCCLINLSIALLCSILHWICVAQTVEEKTTTFGDQIIFCWCFCMCERARSRLMCLITHPELDENPSDVVCVWLCADSNVVCLHFALVYTTACVCVNS